MIDFKSETRKKVNEFAQIKTKIFQLKFVQIRVISSAELRFVDKRTISG